MRDAVICTSCRHENLSTADSCGRCGVTLPSTCPQCGSANPRTARFCSECGLSLRSETLNASGRLFEPPAQDGGSSGMFYATPASAVLSPSENERRQLTVMFCDLVGSTDLSAKLDPEDLREVLRAYHESSAAAIAAHDGYIAQYLGDGLLVYFGYPRAYDDSAVRAVRAALGIVRGMATANERLRQQDGNRLELRVRIGIHSGPVVVSDVGGQLRQERLALGETPNLAARLQGLAVPDHIVISGSTLKLLRDTFDVRDLGEQSLKGIPQPVPVYEVEREKAAPVDGPRVSQSVLVGRQSELSALVAAFHESLSGNGSVALLQGEAGIGKSRQVQALKEQLGSQATHYLSAPCRAGGEATILHPFIALLRQRLRLSEQASDDEIFRRLQTLLSGWTSRGSAVLPLFASLLGIEPGDRYTMPAGTAGQLRQQTLAALVDWVESLAAIGPVLLVVEDLHWADPTTLEVLQLHLSRPAVPRLLVVLTARPEFKVPWGPSPRLRTLLIERLQPDEAKRIVERVTGGRSVPTAVLELILRRSSGVPLFIEEMTRALLDSGRVRLTVEHVEVLGGFDENLIPMTVADSLMARLDRLGPGRALAQLAATVGMQVPLDLLLDLGVMDEPSLRKELSRLVDASVLTREEEGAERYSFRHALLRDSAYQSLSMRTRQRYHALLVRVLQDREPDLEQKQPERLAQHELGAGLIGEAIEHWQLAGQNTAARSAFLESELHYRKALEHIGRLPASRARDRREIDLLAGLGLSLISTQGYTAAELEPSYQRAAALCQTAEDIPFQVIYGLCSVLATRGDRDGFAMLKPQVQKIAETSPHAALRVWAHTALGMTCTFQNEYEEAVEHCERAVALVTENDPKMLLDMLMAHGSDALLYGHFYGAVVHGFRGNAPRAHELLDQAKAIADRLNHRYIDVMLRASSILVYILLGELDGLLELCTKTLHASRENGFVFFVATSLQYRGYLLGVRGEFDAAVAEQRESLAQIKAMGCLVLEAWFHRYLAETLLRAGHIEAGLQEVQLGHAGNRARLGRGRDYSELWRIEGELHARRGDYAQAKTCLERAIVVAREQGATHFERTAAAALAQLPNA